jgi:hypothetical protein
VGCRSQPRSGSLSHTACDPGTHSPRRISRPYVTNVCTHQACQRARQGTAFCGGSGIGVLNQKPLWRFVAAPHQDDCHKSYYDPMADIPTLEGVERCGVGCASLACLPLKKTLKQTGDTLTDSGRAEKKERAGLVATRRTLGPHCHAASSPASAYPVVLLVQPGVNLRLSGQPVVDFGPRRPALRGARIRSDPN